VPFAPDAHLRAPRRARASRSSISLSVGQRRRYVGRKQAPTPSGLATVDFAEQGFPAAPAREPTGKARGCLGSLPSIAMCARTRTRGGVRRARCPRPSSSHRDMKKAARCRKLGTGPGWPMPSSVARAEARLESSVPPPCCRKPPLPAGRCDRPGTVESAIRLISAGGQAREFRRPTQPVRKSTSSNRPVEMSAAAIAQSSPACRSRRASWPRTIRAASPRSSVPGVTEADDRALDQRLRSPRPARLRGALGLLGNCDSVARADQAGQIGLRPRALARRTSAPARHRALAALGSGRCRGRPAATFASSKEELEEVAHPVEHAAHPQPRP
jgi:hypothetical protein